MCTRARGPSTRDIDRQPVPSGIICVDNLCSTEAWKQATNLAMYTSLVLLFLFVSVQGFSNSTRYGTDLLSLLINNDGSFKLLVHNVTWLESYDFGVHCGGQWLTSRPGPNQLHLDAQENDNGENNWGSFTDVNFYWSAPAVGTSWRTVFRFYSSLSVVVFTQVFSSGCGDMGVVTGDTSEKGILEVSSAFPTFKVRGRDPSLPRLNYLTFSGNNVGGSRIGRVWDDEFPGGSHGGVPIVFYDDSNHAVVLSPLDNFLQSIFVQSEAFDGQLVCGLQGKTAGVHGYDPWGHLFGVSYVMVATDRGVRDAMRQWGNHKLGFYGKQRAVGDENWTLQKLGYASDNGAYYYYNTEPGRNYEETLLDVDKYFNVSGLPLGYFQLDSWWYSKSNATGDGGCLLWEPLTDIFPNGMKILNKPVWLHARYFSPLSPYRKNYRFLDSDSPAHPCLLSQDNTFYEAIMNKTRDFAPKQGMVLFEQDWMSTPLMRMNITHTDYTTASWWLNVLNMGARNTNTWLQLDTAFPSEILNSVMMDRAVQGSSGNDYQPGNSQWDDGLSDLLFDAVGLIPWKDTFWTTEKQPGCPSSYSRCCEPNPELQTLLAVLSTGPVSPGDSIGHANVTLLKRACMFDGTLLKPNSPVLPLNKVFIESFDALEWPRVLISEAGPENNSVNWYYIFAAKLANSFIIYPQDIDSTLTQKQSVVVTLAVATVENGEKIVKMTTSSNIIAIQPFDADHPLIVPQMTNFLSDCGEIVPFAYYIIASRQVNEWIVLGELDKFVPGNRFRILDVSPGPNGNGVMVVVVGPIGDLVTISFLPPDLLDVIHIQCCLVPHVTDCCMK